MSRIFDCSVDTELLTGMRLAKQAIERDQLVVLPTDTVYGIAANAFSHKGVQALLDAKGRTAQSPPPVLISSFAQLDALTEFVPEVARKLAEKFWPGALTIILKSQPALQWNLGETKGTVALRMPDHKIALALLEETGPLAVSSANLTGKPAATSVAAAHEYLGDSVQAYLNSGDSPMGESSTILDLTAVSEKIVDGKKVTEGKVKIVRLGALKRAKLKPVLGDLLEADK